MAFKKINGPDMRHNNYKVILDSIRFKDGISRKGICQTIGLTGATITKIVSDLVSLGYVVETGTVQSNNGGRREISLSLNPTVCYAIGVELSASTIVCVLIDFSAQIIDRRVKKIKDIINDKEKIFDAIVDSIETIIKEADVPREKIRGVGLCTPGPCDIEHGVVINPPNLKCLRNVPIKEIISERIGMPVLFEHHMNAAALCEQWLGKAHSSHCMFLCAVLEIGVAGAVMIDGKLHHGSHDAAGEIGHMSVDSNGPVCVCGNYGCLEPLAQGRALVDSVRSKLLSSNELMKELKINNPEEVDIDIILERAENGEAFFRDEVVSRAKYVARALNNVISIISPDTIVLMGEMADKSALYVQAIADDIHARNYPEFVKSIRIYSSEFKRYICALGGATMVLNSVYEDL